METTTPVPKEGTRRPPPRGSWDRLVREILRDREGLLERIFKGEEIGSIVGALLGINGALLAGYGFIMGMTGDGPQAVSSAVKLPVLYLLSLAICLPVLHVLNVLMGSRLRFLQTIALILTALGLNAILLGACAPIALFFIVTGADYHFLKLMHVGILGFGGLWAMGALWRALAAMCEHSSVYPRHAVRILLLWMLVFGFVGTQMAWSLRPYLGAPDLEFEWLRQAGEGNFYTAVWQSLKNL